MTFKPANKDEQLNLLTAIRKKLLAEIVNRPNLLMQIVHIEPLGVKEAIGDPAPYKDFALQRGEERLTEATIIGFKGQAFTSYPSRWRGTLDEALNLSLDSEKNRAIFVATANALGRLLNLCDRTIHCKDQGPDKCGREMAEYIASQFGSEINIGIIGYQPAIVKHMVNFFGNDRVFVTDLNPDNIGNEVFGVKILNGSSCLVELAKNCHIGLITGSTLINGTLNEILDVFKEYGVKPYIYGTTAALPPKILGIERLCFEAI